MTACAYLSPPADLSQPDGPVRAAIIADTLVTLRSSDPEMQFSPGLTPANFSYEFKERPWGFLRRKIQILNKKLIFACAGSGEKITSFSNDVKYKLSDVMDHERPMRLLGDHANRSKIELVGAVIQDLPQGGQWINSVVPNRSTPLASLGKIFGVSGSGGNQLELSIREIDKHLAQCMAMPVEERLIRALNYCNSSRYAHEVASGQFYDWGGYLEMCTNDAGNGWIFSPPTLHIFFFFDTSASPALLREMRLVAYYPFDDGAVILTTNGHAGGFFPLSELFSDRYPDLTRVDDIPINITSLTAVTYTPGGKFRWSNNTVNSGSLSGLVFAVKDRSIYFEMGTGVFKVITEMVEEMGYMVPGTL